MKEITSDAYNQHQLMVNETFKITGNKKSKRRRFKTIRVKVSSKDGIIEHKRLRVYEKL